MRCPQSVPKQKHSSGKKLDLDKMLATISLLAGAGGIIAVTTDRQTPKPISESFETNFVQTAIEEHKAYLWKMTGAGVVIFLIVSKNESKKG